MPRSIWKGSISFGLVSVPVVLYSAQQSADLRFNLLDSRDKAKIRYERVNELTGEEVPWDLIVKGYEYGEGDYVLMRDEDFKQAAVEAVKTIAIEGFVDELEIGSIFYERPYFLVPQKGGAKGYALLREAMKRAGKVGVAKVVIRSRQYLAAVIGWNNMLVLNVMRFSQELQDPEEFKVPEGTLEELKISSKEIDLAKQLIEAMSTKWEPEGYKDEYREALLGWIRKKVKAGKTDQVLTAEEAGVEVEAKGDAEVVDVMALLRKSLEGNGKKKSPETPATKTAAKKKASRKPAAKKARVEKATKPKKAKKSAAKTSERKVASAS